mmetsp:Transcript_5071/g.5265  ORF Transcript_5071/g.5265 Transcript_5071/m.5265 type:complete len:88 (-) Transcript_5071:155-418(-)
MGRPAVSKKRAIPPSIRLFGPPTIIARARLVAYYPKDTCMDLPNTVVLGQQFLPNNEPVYFSGQVLKGVVVQKCVIHPLGRKSGVLI